MVSLDIILEMREHIRKEEPPSNATNAVIMAALLQPSEPLLTESEFRYLMEKLYDGYFGFEVLMDRDNNVESVECVQYLKVEIGMQKNCTPISNEKVRT